MVFAGKIDRAQVAARRLAHRPWPHVIRRTGTAPTAATSTCPSAKPSGWTKPGITSSGHVDASYNCHRRIRPRTSRRARGSDRCRRAGRSSTFCRSDSPAHDVAAGPRRHLQRRGTEGDARRSVVKCAHVACLPLDFPMPIHKRLPGSYPPMPGNCPACGPGPPGTVGMRTQVRSSHWRRSARLARAP